MYEIISVSEGLSKDARKVYLERVADRGYEKRVRAAGRGMRSGSRCEERVAVRVFFLEIKTT